MCFVSLFGDLIVRACKSVCGWVGVLRRVGLYGAENRTLRKKMRSTLKVLKCSTAEGWRKISETDDVRNG